MTPGYFSYRENWIANYKEIVDEATARIYRPRQIYVGPTEQHYVPVEKRGKNS